MKNSLYWSSKRILLKRITELKIQNATYSKPAHFIAWQLTNTSRSSVLRLLAIEDFPRWRIFDLNDSNLLRLFWYFKGRRCYFRLGRAILIKSFVSTNGHFILVTWGDDLVVIFVTMSTGSISVKKFSRCARQCTRVLFGWKRSEGRASGQKTRSKAKPFSIPS